MQIDPDNLHVLIYLAQVLASDENPKVRDGHTAFALASKANTLTGGAQPAMLDVLAWPVPNLGVSTMRKKPRRRPSSRQSQWHDE